MSLNFYDSEEGIEKEESINNYKELFIEFIENPPTLEESLLQIFNSSGLDSDQIDKNINQLKKDCKDKIEPNFNKIKEKYPSLTFDDAIIISTYTCEAIDSKYSPYKILNKNLVSENRKEGIKKISKYLYLLLSKIRLLSRYYPDPSEKHLYRCIDSKVNLMIDPDNEKVVPYIRGKNKTFWAFTSTSPKSKTAIKFLGSQNIKEKEFKYGTIFSLGGKVWGYDITLFNVFNESEILLEPERKYYIENHFPEINDIILLYAKLKIHLLS